MRTKLDNFLKTLAAGRPAEFKETKREIEKLWRQDSGKFRREAPVVFPYLKLFDKIKDPLNKAALASGLSLFFLALADEHFEILEDFSLRVIQNPHGHVREAIRKTADWLYVSLTARVDPFVSRGKKLTETQITNQEVAKEQYREYLRRVFRLMDQYSYQGNDQTNYIDEMKPSVLKSLELLYDRLTYSHHTAEYIYSSAPEIQLKRKEVEDRLTKLLKKSRNHLSLSLIKQIIFLEDEPGDYHKFISLVEDFLPGRMDEILQTLNDAWNHFPHRCLDCRSPVETVFESRGRTS